MLIFSYILIYHIFNFYYYFPPLERTSGHLYKENRLKISTPTLKKPVLSSSVSHTSYTSNPTQPSISSRLDNEHISTNHNKNNISNTNHIQSCVTPQKKIKVFRPTHLTPLNATLSITPVKLHTTTKLPPAGKEYLCFQISGESSQTSKCVKSRIINKVINYILSMVTFEQQCVVLIDMLQ